jgi:L-alanine-DL-glutamate epimerase-like enolase superfamily enzyme
MLTYTPLTLQLRNPFRLSYGTSETRTVYWIRLAGDEGWGEAAIPPYYGVDPAAMTAYWDSAARSTRPLPEQVDEIEAWLPEGGPAPARCAVDLALHDRIGRNQGLPLYSLLNLPEPQALSTSFTIAIDTPEEMARMAREVAAFPAIKLKLGGEGDDEARIAAVREARPDARLRLDANAGWSFEDARVYLKRLQRYNLELIEQPLAKDQIEAMGKLQSETDIPIVADESVQSLADIEQLAYAGVRGVNLKLMKLGGLSAGLRCLRRARDLGLQVMLGCMIETSIGTTAMGHLAGLAEWVDLDAPMLIRNDPFDGLHYDDQARILIPDRPGIGVIQKVA